MKKRRFYERRIELLGNSEQLHLTVYKKKGDV